MGLTEFLILIGIAAALVAVAKLGDDFTQGVGGRHNRNENEMPTYSKHDVDPTIGEPDPLCNFRWAGDDGDDWMCTWAEGHEHPQHVAGDGSYVCDVRPVQGDLAKVYKRGDVFTAAYYWDADEDEGCAYRFPDKTECSWGKHHAHPQHLAVDYDPEANVVRVTQVAPRSE